MHISLGELQSGFHTIENIHNESKFWTQALLTNAEILAGKITSEEVLFSNEKLILMAIVRCAIVCRSTIAEVTIWSYLEGLLSQLDELTESEGLKGYEDVSRFLFTFALMRVLAKIGSKTAAYVENPTFPALGWITKDWKSECLDLMLEWLEDEKGPLRGMVRQTLDCRSPRIVIPEE